MYTRRNFIRQTGVAGLSTLFLPELLKKNELILGQGAHRYRLNNSWSKADFSKFPVNDCHEMIIDSKGRIFLLTNETKNNILIFDRSGKLLDSWGHDYPGAHGLTRHDENGEEMLYICDNKRHQVIKTTLDGRELMVLDYPRETGRYKSAEEYVPTETTIAPNGDIYVADGYGLDYIIQYDAKGRYIRHFGGRGDGPEFLLNAHGVTLDNRNPDLPGLVVSSRQQNAFKRYTLEGEYLSSIELPGAWVCRAVIKGEHLYTAVLQSEDKQWKESGFVTVLDKTDTVVSNLGAELPVYENGRPSSMSQSVQAFQYPHDVCIDDDENLYVAQWNSGKKYPFKLERVA